MRSVLVTNEHHAARNARIREHGGIVSGTARDGLDLETCMATCRKQALDPGWIHRRRFGVQPTVKLKLHAALGSDVLALVAHELVELLQRLAALAAYLEAEAHLAGNHRDRMGGGVGGKDA